MAVVREARREDLDALLGLYQDLHPGEEQLASRGTVEAAWQDMLAAPWLHVFVAEEEGRLASSCVLQLVPNLTRQARPFGLVENVITRQGERRKGYAAMTLRHALEFAWSAGCYKVMLLTGRKEPEVAALYEKAGFKQGLKAGFLALPPGRQ
jgi:GNAT superfamily N-acetyltransferase